MCELIERHVREVCALLGDRNFWSRGVAYSYESLCGFCGHAETMTATAPDAEAAGVFAEVFASSAAGRFCAVGLSALAEFEHIYEQATRGALGDDWPKYQALTFAYLGEIAELQKRYRPRIPYVCRVEGCGCNNLKVAA